MLKYLNTAMSRDEAVDIAADLGPLLARRDAIGRQIPGTTRVNIVPNGAGFDLAIPAEHMAQIVEVLKVRPPLLGEPR